MPNEEFTDIEVYDRAVYAYLVGITPRLVVAPTSRARETIAEFKSGDDKIPWGFISFWRNPTFEFDMSRDSFAAQNFGDYVNALNVAAGKVQGTYVHNIPINLTYSVDVWAATNRRVQQLSLQVLTKLAFSDRVLTAPINPDGENARFHILDLEWVDNSDIEDEENTGRIYRHTFSFTVDARFKLVRTTVTDPFDLSKIPICIYEGDDLDSEVCQECDYEALKTPGSDPDT